MSTNGTKFAALKEAYDLSNDPQPWTQTLPGSGLTVTILLRREEFHDASGRQPVRDYFKAMAEKRAHGGRTNKGLDLNRSEDDYRHCLVTHLFAGGDLTAEEFKEMLTAKERGQYLYPEFFVDARAFCTSNEPFMAQRQPGVALEVSEGNS